MLASMLTMAVENPLDRRHIPCVFVAWLGSTEELLDGFEKGCFVQ
jgi:hypothetical protein